MNPQHHDPRGDQGGDPASDPASDPAGARGSQPAIGVTLEASTTTGPRRRGQRRELVPVDLELAFGAHDPWTISMTFRSAAGAPHWVIARDVLSRGLDTDVGEGDIRVAPARGAAVALALHSPSGYAMLRVPRAGLEQFLARTYELVPAGEESAHYDLDDLVQQLLQSDDA